MSSAWRAFRAHGVREPARELARTLRPWAGALIVAAGLGGFACIVPVAWIDASTAPYRTSADRVPAAPVAIVMGAGLEPDGRPSPFLAGRLRTAADLYRRGKVRAILVTGDNSRTSYDEPTAMQDYLIRHGIPGARIVLDYAGFDTWSSCVRAKKIFGVDRAVVVTQLFHLPRAVALCRSAGIQAYGVGHDSTRMEWVTTDFGYAREVPAAIKAVADLALHPRPRFLGPRESGVQRALAP